MGVSVEGDPRAMCQKHLAGSFMAIGNRRYLRRSSRRPAPRSSGAILIHFSRARARTFGA